MASVTWMYTHRTTLLLFMISLHFIPSFFYVLITFNFVFTGILLSSNSPPVSTPLEPCRVAPYVNLPSIRASSITPATATSSASHQYSSGAAVAAAFSAFDPALLSVAHQVSLCITSTHFKIYFGAKIHISQTFIIQNRKTFLIENNLF